MPSVFICHGAPTLVLENNRYTQFLGQLASKWKKPDAIIVFSAHWESPVIAISVDPQRPPEEQYRIGKVLAPLRQENVLLLGSGATVHNLRMLAWERRDPDDVLPWAKAFDDWLIQHIEKWDQDALFNYSLRAPHAEWAVPTTEHFMPLFLAMGAAAGEQQARLLHRSYDYGTLSMIAMQFGSV